MEALLAMANEGRKITCPELTAIVQSPYHPPTF